MSKEKQIEEMAKLICSSHNNNACVFNHEPCDLNCSAKNNAENIYNAGYRKASDVAREIFEEIEKSIADLEYQAKTPRKTVKVEELKAQCDWILHEIIPKTLAELKKKYTEEGKMREILFRGKRKDNGEWVEGHLHKMDGYGTGYTEHGIQVQDISTSRPWSVLVNPETVGQYTGLTDKNGKKIFEGDIIPVWENGEKYHYKVIYNGDCFMLSMLDSEQGSYPLSVKNSISEIIGNIHDNPELLESEDTE